MADTYVGTGAAATANNDNVTPATPAGIAEGDCKVVQCYHRTAVGAGNFATPAGWTPHPGNPFQRSSNTGRIQLFLKTHVDADAHPLCAVSGGAANSDVIAQVAAWRPDGGVFEFGPTGAQFESAGAEQDIGPIQPPATFPAPSVIGFSACKADDWTGVATLDFSADELTGVEIGEPVSTLGTDGGMVWGFALNPTGASVAAKTFSVTGGTAVPGMGFSWTLQKAAAGAPTPETLAATGVG